MGKAVGVGVAVSGGVGRAAASGVAVGQGVGEGGGVGGTQPAKKIASPASKNSPLCQSFGAPLCIKMLILGRFLAGQGKEKSATLASLAFYTHTTAKLTHNPVHNRKPHPVTLNVLNLMQTGKRPK